MRNLILFLMFFVPTMVLGQMKNDTTVICLPYGVAKQVLLDLNTCDSIKEMNKLTEFELKKTQQKVVLQDSIIKTMELKEDNYEIVITSEREKYKIVEEQNNDLRKDIKKLKTKNTIIEIVGGAIIGGLTYLIIFK